MKTKKGFMLHKVAGQNVVVSTGEEAVDFNGMISFNESGAFLWKILERGASQKELENALLLEYEVTEEVAKKDVNAFLEKLKEANLLDE